MPKKILDLNCKDSSLFEIEYDNNNYLGITQDKDLFTRWLKDLRSGNYTQLRENLYDPENENAYCSLGILCKKRVRRWRQKADSEKIAIDEMDVAADFFEHQNDYFSNVLIITEQGYRFSICEFIIELNDYCKLSFEMIANIIEAINLEIKGEDNTDILNAISKNVSWELTAA